MRALTLLLFLAATTGLHAQTVAAATTEAKPSYCEEATTYAKGGATDAPALPTFATTAIKEFKVQVAILRFTDPAEYPFHPALVARYRPCEQVWVVESRQSFAERGDAEQLQQELNDAGYQGSYITELIAYQ